MRTFWTSLALVLLLPTSATASPASRKTLTPAEEALVRELIDAPVKTRENYIFKENFDLLVNSCEEYKSNIDAISEDIRALRPGQHLVDLYTLPRELSQEKGIRFLNTDVDRFYSALLPGEPFVFNDVPQTNRYLFMARLVRNRLASCFGTVGLQTLDNALMVPDKTSFFIKYGRDSNALSVEDEAFLQTLLEHANSHDIAHSQLETLGNYFYNYRENAKAISDQSDLKVEPARHAIQPREFMMLNLRIDREYFLKDFKTSGLAALDDFLKIPKPLQSELASAPELYFDQTDLRTNKVALFDAVNNIRGTAQKQRPKIWTEEISDEQSLENLITEYILSLAEAASNSQDVYILYSQPNWPRHLEDDADLNRLPPKSQSALNAALQIKWKLEKFSDKKAISELDARQKFVYSSDENLRPFYLPFYRKKMDDYLQW